MVSMQEKIKEHYRKNFDPHEFKKFKLELLQREKWQDNFDFWLSCLYEFFTTEKFSGNRLLDLGSGPTVHNIATAASYFSNIILSEFVESNCDELRKWLRKDSDCMDWSPFIRRVAKAEKRNNIEEACKEIENRIRSAVKAVTHCDVLKDEVIDKQYSQEPFDLILSCLTLENAAADWDSFNTSLAHINRLLRPGGKLILMSVTKCPGYKMGNKKFHFLALDETDIQRAMHDNGFGDFKWNLKDQPLCNEKAYFVISTKL